jgi:hypothetical protein
MTEGNKPRIEGLNIYEAGAVKEVRKLLAKKPEAVLRYLAGDQPPTRALVALALSAQLEITKQKLESMKLTIELCRFLKVGGESNTNDVENDDGRDETPNS